MANGYEYSLIDAEELDEDEDIKTLGEEEEGEEETDSSDEDLTV